MSDNLAKRIENLDYGELKSVTTAVNNADLKGIEKLRVVGVKKDKMVENLTAAVEAIAEKHGEDAIPEGALLLFNDLYGEGETRLDTAPESPSPVESKKESAPKPKPEPEPAPEPEPEPEPAPEPKSKPESEPVPEPETAPEPEPVSKPTPKKRPGRTPKKDATPEKSTYTVEITGIPEYTTDKYGTQPNTLARSFIESLESEPKTMREIQMELWNPKGFVFPRTVERLVEKGLASVDDNGIISLL